MKALFLLLPLLGLLGVVRCSDTSEESSAENSLSFIDSVHAQGAEIAQEMVVDGNQVIWSPYSVVNVLPLINGDVSLKDSFKTSLEYIKDLEGLKVKRVSAAYILDNTTTIDSEVAKNYNTEVIPSVTEGVTVNQVLAQSYEKSIGVRVPEGFIPESLEETSQVYLTSLLLRGVWETPFRYAQKARFYLNETNAVKTKYMTNIGFFKYGEIEGLDAKILALPLKNASTTFFLIVLPNNYSGLSDVSQQFGKVQLGNIMSGLKTARTQLVLPKLDIDTQLVLQPKPSIKILQSGSMRLTYAGFDNLASRLKKSYHKHLRTRVNKKDLKFNVNHPFIFTIYDTEVGVLNYGEVLIPSVENISPIRFKSETVDIKLSQNTKNFVEYYNELGSNLYQKLRSTREGSFAISPVSLAHLLASYSIGANKQVQEQLFSTLNSKDAILEVFNNIYYFNGTSSNYSTIIGNGNVEFKEKVALLGTKVEPHEDVEIGIGLTQGFYNYSFETRLRSTKRFRKTFYLNEKDSINSTFYEYVGRIKYVGLPYWDAKAIQVFVSPTQSLLIFTPNERSGLHLVEEGLVDFSVSKLLCQMSDRFVRLRIPAFEVSYINDIYQDLKDVLAVDSLSFEGLGDAVLDGIVQNVTVSVAGNEDNRHKLRKFKQRKPNTRINLDRPFVFYLIDSTIGSLAVGRIVSLPEAVVPTVVPTVTEEPISSTTDIVVESSSSSSVAPEVFLL